jgi:hypothetical protein
MIIIFNKIDNHRKYNQFKSLKEKLIASEYPARFESLTKSFSVNDTSITKLIQQNLSFLEQDIPEINHSVIYIKDSNYFYKINNEQFYYKQKKLFEKIRFLPQSVQSNIDYLNSTDQLNIDSLYIFTKHNSNIDLMLKVGNGYLFVRHFRE